MRIALSQQGKRKVLIMEGDHIALQAPSNGDPLMIEAELEAGSPIKIVIGNQAPMPVRGLRLVHRNTYRVETFKRTTKAGVVTVHSHDRRMPYRAMRKKHVSI